MSTRSTSLKKIERLYGLMETMHAAALQEAAASMHEAENAITVQRAVMHGARVDAQEALHEGDPQRYALAVMERQVSGHRQQGLELIRQERAIATEAAREVYAASRVQRGQIQAVVEQAAEAERVVAERRAQSAADDRFLSRLRWTQLREPSV